MDQSELDREAAAFFDAFVVAFQSFRGSEIARRYVAPYVALHDDGSRECFGSDIEIAQYFQRVVSVYHDQGCRSCRYHDLAVAPLGGQSALASVTWELLSGEGVVMSSWRESYNLCRIDGRFRVFASVDHVT
ncbi:hypothetical protein [Phreatobacter stygius]|uniref:DUF4440 domain-containing protein n=1 Tax=Phreatobacter stygius TaxID=1940610 RepID=A0A4D7BFE6_9HYPH|nr:hypothetical protein [Phreatobacter stygius]QCI68598.1 hypothetical protein E8M01_32835 [Phreatobacter stygius]